MREEWFIRSIVVIRSQMFHDIHQITSPLCHSSGQITMPMWSPSQIPLLLVIELGYQQWLRWATCPIWRKYSFISRARGCFWRFSMHFFKGIKCDCSWNKKCWQWIQSVSWFSEKDKRQNYKMELMLLSSSDRNC